MERLNGARCVRDGELERGTVCARIVRVTARRAMTARRAVTDCAVTGCAVTGCAVTGCAVTGCAVTDCAVTGCAVTGCAVTGCAVTDCAVTDGWVPRRDYPAMAMHAGGLSAASRTPQWPREMYGRHARLSAAARVGQARRAALDTLIPRTKPGNVSGGELFFNEDTLLTCVHMRVVHAHAARMSCVRTQAGVFFESK
jgi:hypothetical protein